MHFVASSLPRWLPGLVLLSAVAACVDADEGESDAPADALAEGQFQTLQSFTLTFESMTGVQLTRPQATARLDLLEDAGALKAVLTMEWSPPSPCTAQVIAGQLQLACTADVKWTASKRYDRERWNSVIIPLTSTGKLGGTFSATGVFRSCGDDYCLGGNDISGQGSVASDITEPRVKAAMGALPWNPVSVDFSEPVDPAVAIAHLQASINGTPVAATWQPVFVGPVGNMMTSLPQNDEASTVWTGRMSFLGRLSAWPGASGASLDIVSTPGLVDPSGNEALPLSQTTHLLDMKTPASSFDFDAAIVAGTWGTAALADGTECDQGGCLKLGPAVSCSVPTGVAGLLPAGTRTKMRLRYRAGYGTNMAYDPAHGIEVALASPGQGPLGVTLPDLDYHVVTKGPDHLDKLSDWTTAEVALPTEVQNGEAGFSIEFRRMCIQYGEPFRAVWIESIVFE